ncbi:MAG: hypothetical protein IJM51_08980 [Clostridia bacterium]|nr:hypothetical protein [Clostridia bacterium]
MTNAKIRFHAMETGVKLYKVAAELGICDSSLSRKLRKELDEEETTRIMEIIDRLATEKNATAAPAAAQA